MTKINKRQLPGGRHTTFSVVRLGQIQPKASASLCRKFHPVSLNHCCRSFRQTSLQWADFTVTWLNSVLNFKLLWQYTVLRKKNCSFVRLTEVYWSLLNPGSGPEEAVEWFPSCYSWRVNSLLLPSAEFSPPHSGHLAVYRSVRGDGLQILCGLCSMPPPPPLHFTWLIGLSPGGARIYTESPCSLNQTHPDSLLNRRI